MDQIIALLQVILLDVCLSGDNAIIIAMAAMALPVPQRKAAIFFGISLAIVLRIIFSSVAVLLLRVPGLPIVAGLALFWVSWKMWQELRATNSDQKNIVAKATMGAAILQITVADASMSIDNVLAVAAVSINHIYIMAFGLILSIGLMGIAANIVTKILDRWPVLKYLGLALILYVASSMITKYGLRLINV